MGMKPFKNQTTNTNENAIKRGSSVPDGAINLAWVQTPALNPAENIVILDTSRITAENTEDTSVKRKLMYANIHGILEDINGNQVVEEEFPFVTDVFSVDEDFLTVPGSEYIDDDILPFVHVSRYFHLDFPGIALGSSLQSFNSGQVKIVDSKGRDYIRPDGTRRYRVNITPAYTNMPSASTSAAYRLFVFVDDDTNEDLYLKYDKVEIDEVTGLLKNQEIAYQEILNPQAYFQNQPEESDVIDPVNRKQKWYASKPISAKDQAIGSNTNPTNGYRIYVPRKAITDPRIFQMFRWRINCEFTQTYKTDTSQRIELVNCGVVETGSAKSSAPYVFLNLWQSQYNLNHVNFVNPLHDSTPSSASNSGNDSFSPNVTTTSTMLNQKETRAYWTVPFDTLSLDDLKKFDILFWSPNSIQFDFTPYLNKIRYFTETLGRTLVIDTANYTYPTGLMADTTAPIDSTGTKYVSSATAGLANPTTATYDFSNSPLLSGTVSLGGWDIRNGSTDVQTLGPYTNPEKPLGINNIPYLTNVGNDYGSVMVSSTIAATPNTVPQMIHHVTSTGGNVIIATTATYAACGWIWSTDSAHLIDFNRKDNRYTGANYYHMINSYLIKGAMKLFYNTVLLSVKNKSITDPTNSFSSTWSYTTPWKSEWVINCWNNVLNDEEKSKYNFTLLPRSSEDSTPVWQKRLSGKTMDQLVNETLSDEDTQRLNGAERSYTIEVSNYQVKTTPGLPGSSPPYAYTEAYSPRFEVPVELGPNIVREELIHQQVGSSQFANFSYPPKPYGLKVNASYSTASEHLQSGLVHWTATGTATRTIVTTTPASGTSTPTPAPTPAPPIVIPIDPPPHFPTVTPTPPAPTTQEIILNWRDNGASVFYTSPLYPEFGMPTPLGISTWQEANYYNDAFGSGAQCWPHFGMEQRIQQGDSGEAVHLVQKSINAFKFWGFMDTGVGYLAEDGVFGSLTKTAVTSMQSTFKARYIDGVVDAESWGIIGSEVLRLASTLNALGKPLVDPNDPITHWWNDIQTNMDRRNISNGVEWDVYRKRSWISNGPSVIWELFCVTFNQDYDIHGITIKPYVLGQTNNIMFRSVHVTHMEANQQGAMLTQYDAGRGQLTYMPHRPVHGQKFYLPIGPYRGNTIIVGVGQDGPSGYGTSRQLGIAELWAHATVTVPGVVAHSPIATIVPALTSSSNWITNSFAGVIKAALSNTTTDFNLTWDGTRLTFHSTDSVGYGMFHNGAYYTDDNGELIYNNNSIAIPVQDQNGTYTMRKASATANPDVCSYTFQPPTTVTTTSTINIKASGQATVITGTDVHQKAHPSYSGGGTLSNIKWTSIIDDNSDIESTITTNGQVTLRNHNAAIDISGVNFTEGPELTSGGTSFYSMTTNKRLNPGYETGFVSKSNGFKLICNQDLSPYGFPTLPSSSSTDTVSQRHYGTMSIISTSSDSSIRFGFYDIRTQEFITNNSSSPTISYVEYLTRGPQNVYVAVYSSYSETTTDFLPNTDDAPSIPFRWAMPVYGVGLRHASHIGIESLPAKLGSEDIWSLPIRTGSFNRTVTINNREENPLTTYIKKYQGTTVKAFYSIPEAENGWSPIYGRPYIDIVDEQPLILDDNIIQVRQSPILLIQEPSVRSSQADPLHAIFKVSQRANVSSPWVELDRTDIADYNVSNGIIYLKNVLPSSDPACVKVNYTTARSVYNLKQMAGKKINLNPRLAKQNNLFGKPIYIYILPHYVLDGAGKIISESVTDTTLNFTFDSTIFDPLNPAFDPLAVQLGIVYIVTNLDINNLIILDTRSRGGGAHGGASLSDLKKTIDDVYGYWDIGDGVGQSYQRGGFVLIRLPEQLKDQFPNEQDIIDAIHRNITAGVQFKVETLQGGKW